MSCPQQRTKTETEEANAYVPYVLFADDDNDTLLMLTTGAKHRGWKYDTASRARDILTKVNEHCNEHGTCYDAIVTDINFQDAQEPGVLRPRLTGVTAIKEIRKEYPDVPVIYYTGFDNLLIREQAQKSGGEASDFVVKSRPDTLEERAKGELDRVLDRVASLLSWVHKNRKNNGKDRRTHAENGTFHHRRKGEGGPMVTVPPVLERAIQQVKGLFKSGAEG